MGITKWNPRTNSTTRCRKVGVQCSSICGHNNGEASLSASSYPNNIDEESHYELVVLEALEPNIRDNDDDDQELET